MAAPTNQPTSFLNLSGEFRNRIYRLALPTAPFHDIATIQHAVDVAKRGVQSLPGPIGLEASSIFFTRKIVTVDPTNIATIPFLACLGADRRAMIEHLNITIPETQFRTEQAGLKKVLRYVRSIRGWSGEGLRSDAVWVNSLEVDLEKGRKEYGYQRAALDRVSVGEGFEQLIQYRGIEVVGKGKEGREWYARLLDA